MPLGTPLVIPGRAKRGEGDPGAETASPSERAALAWTEAVTRIADAHVSDAVYTEAASHFDEKELVDLTLAVIAINGWNRLAITFQASVGGYQPAKP